MAFAAARMIKEKKNLEAEHKKRSSDGLSKTKSKVILPHVLTHQNHIRHPQGHITSYLDTSWHTTTAKWFFSYHVMTTSMVSYHVNAMVPYQWKYHLTKDTGVGFAITSFIWLQMTHETVRDCKYNIHDIHSPINSLSFQNSIFAEHVFFSYSLRFSSPTTWIRSSKLKSYTA